MALKFKLKSKDEIPAELVNLYVERDGAWLLDVEGAVEKVRYRIEVAPEAGLEPATFRLTAGRSTIELLWIPEKAAIYKAVGGTSNGFCPPRARRSGGPGTPGAGPYLREPG